MAILRAFHALRPPPEKVHLVASVPYDVVNTEEARALAADNPLSLLHVSRPEIDLPPSVDIYDDEVYTKGAENFHKLLRQVPLTKDKDDALYVYRLEMKGHAQVGIVGCCAVEDYDNEVIRKHERTRKDKEDDRTRHIVTLQAQTGPVFLCYRDVPAVDQMVSAVMKDAPLYDFTAPDGVKHTMWRFTDTAGVVRAIGAVPRLYIADGHHRAASASRAQKELARTNLNHSGREQYNSFLSVLFPASQLQILPYNRVIKDLSGLSGSAFLAAMKDVFHVTENAPATPKAKGDVSFFHHGKWYGFNLGPQGAKVPRKTEGGKVRARVPLNPHHDPSQDGWLTIDDSPITRLDCWLLQSLVLAPLFGIADPRTDKRIDFVGGIRGTAELEKLVSSDKAAVAFSMFPTTVDDLMAIADAGEIMPPKSTWFEPKLRSGLVIHQI